MNLLVILGIIMMVLTAKTAYRNFVGLPPVAYFPFRDGKYQFDLTEPGNYAIMIKNLQHLKEVQPIDIKLKLNDTIPIEVERNFVRPTIYVDGKDSIQYANFFTDNHGQLEIEFINLKHAEVWEHGLWTARLFTSPLEHKSVAVAIQKHDKPLYHILAFSIFIGGAICIVLSMVGPGK